MRKLFVVVLALWLFGCATPGANTEIGRLQSDLVTLTVNCDKCKSGLTDFCQDDPCGQIQVKVAELRKLLN